MSEPLSEQQTSMLVLRAPLSEDGFVSIYFSSRDGRLMSLSEWSHLKQLIELTSKCVSRMKRMLRQLVHEISPNLAAGRTESKK
jgi:hypothetical protein